MKEEKKQVVYLVEDDDNIRELVEYALGSSGYEAAGFAQGSDFFAAVEAGIPDLVLLDIMLPEEDGLALLKRLRKDAATKEIPVIMLTAKVGEYDRVKGFDYGADDYVTKPFYVTELMSRVKALLKRAAPGGDNAGGVFEIGPVSLDVAKRSAFVSGAEVSLTFKEFELLKHLMENEGIVFSREKLLSGIWGYDYAGETRTVDMHVMSLRQKLGAGADIIKTVRNVGYKAVE
ncbi:MAG: response regulator transcription factor [Clostridiales Family XIII bacterium]|jgi:two-component system alkaline phosphatase synthesis response regulator PhoP|nr:response regulator transcription factor [Clostridiales Family XIII bacterium]